MKAHKRITNLGHNLVSQDALGSVINRHSPLHLILSWSLTARGLHTSGILIQSQPNFVGPNNICAENKFILAWHTSPLLPVMSFSVTEFADMAGSKEAN